MIPLYTSFTLPIQPAAFLVERATQGNTMTLEVQVGQSAMRADRSFQYSGGGVGAKGPTTSESNYATEPVEFGPISEAVSLDLGRYQTCTPGCALPQATVPSAPQL